MLQIKGITRAFGQKTVLKGVNLEVEPGEILCLLGASGCGKTTLLRIIAGLEQADSGDVLLNGASIMSLPVHTRDFGLMFQDFALFPHMNVAQNVRFGLRMRGAAPTQQAQRLREVLALVGLEGFEARDVTSLSGGERQRVALARSLAPNPRLLMLDEPLGSLDAALRERLVVELRAIIKHVGLTALYVTHDQREAFAIADRIAIINDGQVEQIDRAEGLYARPLTAFVARFLGLHNIVAVLKNDGDQVQTAVGTFAVSRHDGHAPKHILLHPDHLQLVTQETESAIAATVQERVFLGDSYRYLAQHTSGITLMFKCVAAHPLLPAVGDAVYLRASAVIPLSV